MSSYADDSYGRDNPQADYLAGDLLANSQPPTYETSRGRRRRMFERRDSAAQSPRQTQYATAEAVSDESETPPRPSPGPAPAASTQDEQAYYDDGYYDDDGYYNQAFATPSEQVGSTEYRGQRLVISLDFGTTFTGLAHTTTDARNVAELDKIRVLQNWTPAMDNFDKIPSVKSYSKPTRSEAQWGTDLSPNAITMVNQKLELEQQEKRLDELDLTLYVLRGAGYLNFDSLQVALSTSSSPDFTYKMPEEIVADYLKHIFECAYRTVIKRSNIRIDLVITVPVDWSYGAYNSLFRAVRKAGFNEKSLPTFGDMMLVTEPEAAAYFTARELKRRGEAGFLREGHCFVLCDAGGGTVDVVSYQVTQETPLLELRKITKPSGRKCGSAMVDTKFKIWLRDTLGHDRFCQLDPTNAQDQRISAHTAESPAMRALIKQFSARKEIFSTQDKSPIILELPKPLDNLNLADRMGQGDLRVNQGDLKLHWLVDSHGREMKKLMDDCVNATIELILEQIKQVEQEQKRRVKNVFLVGGFGASPYLQDQLNKNLREIEKTVRRPDADKSLTAVVQGGVIFGVEKARHQALTYLRAIKRSYGVLLEGGRFEWMIKKGDLLYSNKTEVIESTSFWHHPDMNLVRGKHEFRVYYHTEDGPEYENDLPSDWNQGQHEVMVAANIRVYFPGSVIDTASDHRRARWSGVVPPNLSREKIGPLKWRMTLSDTVIRAELILKDEDFGTGRPVGYREINMTSQTAQRLASIVPDDAYE